MKFSRAELAGVHVIELDLKEDARGFFARTYCEADFEKHGLNTRWPQCSLSYTKKRGMVRGLHYQAEPKPEIKLIRCARGAIFDVVADLREESATYGQWQAFELNDQNRLALYVPAGFAHGFQCLADDCEVYYHISELYVPELARGVRWDDPALAIPWPIRDAFVSERDRSLPAFEPKV
jgi:dTDP-4-dehydrorhamnose 3,5-epimerase